jgi:hypothetical protein
MKNRQNEWCLWVSEKNSDDVRPKQTKSDKKLHDFFYSLCFSF